MIVLIYERKFTTAVEPMPVNVDQAVEQGEELGNGQLVVVNKEAELPSSLGVEVEESL